MWGMQEHLFNSASLFFSDATKIALVVASLVLAVTLLAFSRRAEISAKVRSVLMYGHLSLLIFPVVLFALSLKCSEVMLCEVSATKAVLLTLPFAILFALLAGLVIVPLLHRSRGFRENGPLQEYVSGQAGRLGMRAPDVLLLDSSKPCAYSVGGLKPAIFVSTGMRKALKKKELEAVLLHELAHIREGSHALKTLAIFLKSWHPHAMPAPSAVVLDEERKADRFAVVSQKTAIHLHNAKLKTS